MARHDPAKPYNADVLSDVDVYYLTEAISGSVN